MPDCGRVRREHRCAGGVQPGGLVVEGGVVVAVERELAGDPRAEEQRRGRAGERARLRRGEQVEQGRLRVFFAVRDDAKRVARFDLHPGEVQAFHALVLRRRAAIPEKPDSFGDCSNSTVSTTTALTNRLNSGG